MKAARAAKTSEKHSINQSFGSSVSSSKKGRTSKIKVKHSSKSKIITAKETKIKVKKFDLP